MNFFTRNKYTTAKTMVNKPKAENGECKKKKIQNFPKYELLNSSFQTIYLVEENY